jgi:hypothetical protein
MFKVRVTFNFDRLILDESLMLQTSSPLLFSFSVCTSVHDVLFFFSSLLTSETEPHVLHRCFIAPNAFLVETDLCFFQSVRSDLMPDTEEAVFAKLNCSRLGVFLHVGRLMEKGLFLHSSKRNERITGKHTV